MEHPLDGVFAKLDRVEEHLDNLFAEVTTYVENDPYEFVVTDGEEPGLHLIHAYERVPPPLRFAVIFGDVIHNLRSSLDHLAWQLVEANGGNTDGMSFPICRDLAVFEQQKWPKRLRQMSSEDAAAVERLQPFPGRTGRRYEALRWVNTQSNIDKHRLVMPAYVAVVDSEIRLRAIPADVTIEVPIQGGENIRLEDGALVARLGPVRASPPTDPIPQGAEPPKLDVYINTSPLLEPVFGDGLRMNFLPPIAKDIRAIVEEFAHRFAPPSTDA